MPWIICDRFLQNCKLLQFGEIYSYEKGEDCIPPPGAGEKLVSVIHPWAGHHN